LQRSYYRKQFDTESKLKNKLKLLKNNIMKTNFKTFIAVCVLSVAGIAGANASTTEAINKSMASSANAKMFAEAFFQREAQMVNRWIADREEEKAIQELVDEGYSVAKEPTATNHPNFRGHRQAPFYFGLLHINFQKDAEQTMQSIADREEAKAINKLIEQGILAETK
jgi:hypothetical protein